MASLSLRRQRELRRQQVYETTSGYRLMFRRRMCCRMTIVCCPLTIVCCLLSVVRCPLSVVCCLLSVVCCPLSRKAKRNSHGFDPKLPYFYPLNHIVLTRKCHTFQTRKNEKKFGCFGKRSYLCKTFLEVENGVAGRFRG